MHQLEVSYQGRVQGVGFRATVADLATTFSVAGMVQNRIDGSVRLVAQGDEKELLSFKQAISTRLNRNIVKEAESWKPIESPTFGDFRIGPTE